jgi:hypothetical protein
MGEGGVPPGEGYFAGEEKEFCRRTGRRVMFKAPALHCLSPGNISQFSMNTRAFGPRKGIMAEPDPAQSFKPQ